MLACVELSLNPIVMTTSLKQQGTTSSVDQINTADEIEKIKQSRRARERLICGFFTWLRDKKKVRRIVKLLVDDHSTQPCSDEIIEQCLAGFEIRYLNWNKDDFCLSSLIDNTPNIRELSVSWSGNYSTLMGWSNEKYGLGQLKKVGYCGRSM